MYIYNISYYYQMSADRVGLFLKSLGSLSFVTPFFQDIIFHSVVAICELSAAKSRIENQDPSFCAKKNT